MLDYEPQVALDGAARAIFSAAMRSGDPASQWTALCPASPSLSGDGQQQHHQERRAEVSEQPDRDAGPPLPGRDDREQQGDHPSYYQPVPNSERSFHDRAIAYQREDCKREIFFIVPPPSGSFPFERGDLREEEAKLRELLYQAFSAAFRKVWRTPSSKPDHAPVQLTPSPDPLCAARKQRLLDGSSYPFRRTR